MTPQTDERRGMTSASNALADSLCPARFLAQVGFADTSSEDSRKGDRIHRALAFNARLGLGDQDNPIHLALEDREVFDMCKEDERKLISQYLGDAPPPHGFFRAFREQRYWTRFNKDGKQYAHSGKADVVHRLNTKALVIDYKTGRNEVSESPRNLQLRDLAVLAKGSLAPISEVATAIVQPFVTREPLICVYDAAALAQAERDMFERVVRSNTPGQPRIPGEAQCEFCRAKRGCAEYQKWAAQMTPPAMLTVLEVPMVSWTPEQRALAASALGPAEKMLRELKEFLKEGLKKDPAFCPGWQLTAGRKTEVIIDPTECFKRFLAVGGTQEAFMRCVKVVKSALKEELHGATNARGKALETGMKTLTDGIVRTSVSEGSLVRKEEQ